MSPKHRAQRAKLGEGRLPGEFQHVHRLSPLLRLWSAILGIGLVVAFNYYKQVNGFVHALANDITGLGPAAVALGLVVAVFIGGWLLSQIWWRAYGYRLGQEDVSVQHGVVTSRLRQARYDRIQAVDVSQRIIPRLFGLAEVRVEAAGGADSSLEIAFLPLEQANALRDELLGLRRKARRGAVEDRSGAQPAVARPRTNMSLLVHQASLPWWPPSLQRAAAGMGAYAAGGAAAEMDAVEQGPARVLVPPIPVRRTLLATLLTGGTIFSLGLSLSSLHGAVTFSLFVPFILGTIPSIWRIIDGAWEYTSLNQGGHLVLRYGLANRQQQTVPLHRIHAVRAYQPILWHLVGWWRVEATVAGYKSAVVLPVGSKQQAEHVVQEVLQAPLFSAPTISSPRRAVWVAPLSGWVQCATVGEDFVATRRNLLRPRVDVVKTSHIQELSLDTGPLDRALNLATLRMDLVRGKAAPRIVNGERAQVVEILQRLRVRDLPPPERPGALTAAEYAQSGGGGE